MPRPLAFALLVAVAAVAAPVPKKVAKDYQKLAEETEWQFAEFNFDDTLAAELKGYEVTATAGDTPLDVAVQVSKDGKELLSLPTHRWAVVRQRDGVVYYTDFDPISPGCSVVAFDLNAKKRLWKCDLKGLGWFNNSKYRNKVRMEVLDDDTLRVFGKESSGRYVEIVSRGTGKRVGHKLFDEKK